MVRCSFPCHHAAMPLKDPTFTIGIEEEYLLVDRASRDLVREMPHALFEAAQQALQGQVAREFLKSQIEVGTGVHASPRAAGAELAALRRTVAQPRRRARPGPHRRLHPPLRALEHPGADRARALPGHRPRPRRRRPPPRHLRHARARRHRGRRAAHRPHEPGALFPAAPADALDLLAVRRGRGHRPQVLPPRRLPGAAAHGPARPLRELGGIPPHRRPAGAQRRHRGRQQDLVGPAPLRPLPDARDAHHRRVHPARGCRERGGHVRVASCACSTASAAPTRPGAPIRCSCCRRTAGARSATASPARCSISARASWWPSATSSRSCWCCCGRTPRRWAACPRSSTPAPSSPRGTSADRQVACYQSLTAAGAPREEALEGVVDHLIAETVATDPAK